MTIDLSQSKVLIVDDQESNQKLLETILNKENYEKYFASDGIEALKKIKEILPDIILLDIMMPNMDGFEVIEKLKSNKTYNDIPIILLTALEDSNSKLKALGLGAEDYLTKPFNYSEVLLRIRNLLRLKKMTDLLKNNNELLDQIDLVTGLPNQKTIKTLIDKKILDGESNLSFLIIRITGLKKLIDALGKEKTSFILKTVSDRITIINKLLPNSLLSYLGSGNFLLVFPDASKEWLEKLANKLTQSFNLPIRLENDELFITIKMGAALCPENGKNIDLLISFAETAANNSSKSCILAYYNRTMQLSSQKELAISTNLHYAIENDELEQYYQPIVNIGSGKIIGAEALMRWKKDDDFIPPDKFIPIAEELGMMSKLHEWSLNTLATSLNNLKDAIHDEFYISINVSPTLFFQEGLSEKIITLNNSFNKNIQLVVEVVNPPNLKRFEKRIFQFTC